MNVFTKLMLLSGIALSSLTHAEWDHKKPFEQYEQKDLLELVFLINAKKSEAGLPILAYLDKSVLEGGCGQTLTIGCASCVKDSVTIQDVNHDHNHCAHHQELPVVAELKQQENKDILVETLSIPAQVVSQEAAAAYEAAITNPSAIIIPEVVEVVGNPYPTRQD